jgi:hypothetical protein
MSRSYSLQKLGNYIKLVSISEVKNFNYSARLM